MDLFPPVIGIHPKIYLIRGQRVMLSIELARLYGITPRALMRRVLWNKEKFSEDFLFQLSPGEAQTIRYRKLLYFRGRYFKHAPYAFTKVGVAMVACVLKNPRAIELNLALARAHPGWLTSLPRDFEGIL